ncbi:hypothetical protein MP228_011530 [Amoeboaphelidium protococcarum]|nr:hypothetical protein MP228_011530 [Amoeboaphelidium protococcarum]
MSNQGSRKKDKSSAMVSLLLVVGMLATGTANTLLNKFQDKQCVRDCDTDNPKHYAQPVWQTLTMFIGEFLCMLVYWIGNVYRRSQKSSSVKKFDVAGSAQFDEDEPLLKGSSSAADTLPIEDDLGGGVIGVEQQFARKELKGYANFLLWLPTLCDIVGTTLMNVGLLVVAASVYQMLRGAVVIFTGILSFLILRIKLPLYRIIALSTVMVGVALVGLAPTLFKDDKAVDTHASFLSPSVGVLFILAAQISSAFQFVIEEKIIINYTGTPIKLVGLEGLFGLITLLLFMPIFHFTFGKDTGGYFDLVSGYEDLASSPAVWGSSIGCALSIAFFNYFGLNVTRYISATSRTTIDTCRTLFIWIISLALGWEIFIWLQVVGFLVLIYGTFVFNDVIPLVPNFIKSRLQKNCERS